MALGQPKTPEQQTLESRTDEKLEYAREILALLRSFPHWDHNLALVRALEESVLYHVIGARDAFLQEISAAYRLGLRLEDVRINTLRTKLGGRSSEFNEIEKLSYRYPKKRWSWLAMSLEIRDHGTHRARPPREYFEGGPLHGTVRYRSPRYRRQVAQAIPDMLESSINKMTALIGRLRRTLPW